MWDLFFRGIGLYWPNHVFFCQIPGFTLPISSGLNHPTAGAFLNPWKTADFSTAFSSSSPPIAIFHDKSSSYWAPPWKWKPLQYRGFINMKTRKLAASPQASCWTPMKSPCIPMGETPGVPMGFPMTMGTSHRFWTLGFSDRRPWRMIACCWKSCCVWTAAPCVMPRASCAERGSAVGMGGFKKEWSSDYKIGILET